MTFTRSSSKETAIKAFPVFFGKSGLDDPRFQDWLLVKNFKSLGVTFVQAGEATDVWFFDFDLNSLRTFFTPKVSGKRKTLFVLEPEAVNPLVHSKSIQGMFDLVVTFDSTNTPLETLFKVKRINIPYRGHLGNPDGSLLWHRSPKVPSIAMAAGDKQSVALSNRYWLRRDFVLAAVKANLKVELAGPGWNENSWFRVKQITQSALSLLLVGKMPNFKLCRPNRLAEKASSENLNLRGWVDNESHFYSESQIVVVIENDENFHSEKLYAALSTDSHVIYVGPATPDLDNLEELTVCEPNVESLLDAVKTALEKFSESKSLDKRMDFLRRRNLERFYLELAMAVTSFLRRKVDK